MDYSDISIYISLHTTPTIERKTLYRNCIRSVRDQKCKAYLICDENTEQDNIQFALESGIDAYKTVNRIDSGMNKFLISLKKCKTKYCAFIQDDDAYSYDYINKVVKALNRITFEPVIIFTNVIFLFYGVFTHIQSILQWDGSYYLTPPSKWIINTEIVNKIIDIEEFNSWSGWDNALARQILSMGIGAYIKDTYIMYNFHDTNAEKNNSKVDSKVEEYIKKFTIKPTILNI